jgi:hypothetical protein
MPKSALPHCGRAFYFKHPEGGESDDLAYCIGER